VAAIPAPAPAVPVPGSAEVATLRRLWDDILDAVKQRNRSAHAMLKEYAQVVAVDTRAVTLAFKTPAIGRQFEQKSEFFRDALREIAGMDLAVKVGAAEPAAATGSAAPASAPGDDVDVVDLTDDDDPPADVAEPIDPVALLQSELSAQVIDRIDGS
jgi:DNA polymerase-3 subunit gamma/tau